VSILIVEDEALIRELMAVDLTEAGHEVLQASNADDAIEILNARLDITHMITDIDMPGSMDGLKLAYAVRGRWPPVKIVICSGKHRLASDRLPIGSKFVPKPFLFHHITAAMDELRSFKP
jgi:DNA-binding NtrC family response regulator